MSDGFFPCYVLEVSSYYLDVIALYNNWPTHRDASTTESVTTSTRLNEMTLEGDNVVRLLVKPLAEIIPPQAFVQVQLFRMLAKDDMSLVFRHSWNPVVRPLVLGEYTEVCRHELRWARTFGRWEWESGRPYMPEDRPAILDLVRQHRAALENQDFETYAELNRVKLEEVARATGKNVAGVRDEQVKNLQAFAGIEGWVIPPLDPETLLIESCCDGRLVQVFASEKRKEVFQGLIGGMTPMGFALTAGRVNGVWTAVR